MISSTPEAPPDKQQTVTSFAALGETLLVLDARQPGVQVPAHLRGERELRLKFSYRYDTGGLVIDERGVRQALHFNGPNGGVHVCFVPWSAVIAAVCVSKSLGCGWDRPAEPKPRPSHLRLVN
jgi:stringent starvation protein B